MTRLDKLHIEELKYHFKNYSVFKTSEVIDLYSKIDPKIKRSTINWRVYALVQKGILKRVGRGEFTLGVNKNFFPEISPRMKSINNKLRKEFPYLNFCIWNTSSINEFMIHQPGNFYLIIEVEKESAQSVFYFLRELKYHVFIDPTDEILEKYLFSDKEAIIIKTLISEAPIQKTNEFNTISLEKLLVDIFCDPTIFSAQQGAEMRTIFKEAFTKYSVNRSRMLRYANRRRKKESLQIYLSTFQIYGSNS